MTKPAAKAKTEKPIAKMDTSPTDTSKRDLSQAIPKAKKEDVSKRVAEIRADRAQRGNMDGLDQRLAVPEDRKDPNYHYRWVNDADMRVHRMQQKGYEFAESELDVASTGDKGMGTRVERTVNERSTKGQPQKGFLMKTPKEIFEEDQAAKEAKRKELERSMEKGQTQSPEGLSGPNAYVVPGTKLT